VLTATQDVKKLWASVRSTTAHNRKQSLTSAIPLSANDFVDFFTDIATDPTYDLDTITETINHLSSRFANNPSDTNHDTFVFEYEVFRSISQVKKTSHGPDNTPYWLFKHCAMERTPIITHIVNLSLTQGRPPNLWKRAIITPVPKVSNPKELADFRPISVTPLISRIVERILVNKFVLPALPVNLLADQFAYRPTCSTTAALVALEHHTAQYLESASFVRCLLIDYSKAFDTISHPILF